ncbi:hypothetical protein CKA32_000995 [Geitlerinema sp. FC II]|nr:hypothetical protein CKA32_000995 [Geitlerinema sp. FC II]
MLVHPFYTFESLLVKFTARIKKISLFVSYILAKLINQQLC